MVKRGACDALLDEPAGHVEVVENFERAGIDHGRARRVGARGLTVDHSRRNTLLDQRRGQRESARARSDDEDIGVVHFVSSSLMPTLVGITMRASTALCQHLLAYTCWHA